LAWGSIGQELYVCIIRAKPPQAEYREMLLNESSETEVQSWHGTGWDNNMLYAQSEQSSRETVKESFIKPEMKK
jgi:hypothetical protein